MSIVVFVNPGSRANRRDPDHARRFALILGETGHVLTPASSDALAAEARQVAEAQPSIIGVHGGDGTLHWTVTALVRAYGERPLPPLALLPGGTMNVVASSLGILAQPEALLAQLVAEEKAARDLLAKQLLQQARHWPLLQRSRRRGALFVRRGHHHFGL